MTQQYRFSIERDGFAILTGGIPHERVRLVVASLEAALARQPVATGSIRSSRALVYGARNLISAWPGTLELARAPTIRSAVMWYGGGVRWGHGDSLGSDITRRANVGAVRVPYSYTIRFCVA